MGHSRYDRADRADLAAGSDGTSVTAGSRPRLSPIGATLLLLLVVSLRASGEPGSIDASTFERIDDYLVGRMANYGIPGMAVGFVGIDGARYVKGYGAADPSGREVTPQTPFVIGSVSKPFTALAIMQLAESGRLTIDDPVVAHLPWFRLAGGEGDAITVRQLLLQTSGIGTDAEWQVAATDGGDSLDDLVRKMAAMKPARAPGGGYRYSNANYVILGKVVEAVSGLPYGEYVKRFIFEPLGMRHSHVSRPEAELDGLARGHVSWFGLSRPSSLPYRNDFAPAYYVVSCAEDLTRFLAMFMNGGTLGSASLLSADGIAEMLTAGEGSRYGMGWFVGSENVYHGGSTTEYLAKVNILFDMGVGSVMLCNASDSTAQTLFGAGYRDVVESDMLSILFGHDEEVGRFADPPGSALLATVQIAILLAIVGLLVVSLVRLATFGNRLRTSKPARVVTGSILANAIVPAALLLGPPLAARARWPVLLYHYRDIASVVLGVATVLLAEGVAKAAIALTSRTRVAPRERRSIDRASSRQRESASDS